MEVNKMTVIIQLLVNSLLIGGFYALVATGFSLVWGVMNVINMVHGTLLMLGSYVTYYLFVQGADPLVTLPIPVLAIFLLGYFMQRQIINPVVKAPVWMTLVLTFGLELLITNLAIFFFSASPVSVNIGYGSKSISVGDIRIPLMNLVVFISAIVTSFVLFYIVDKTRLGRAIQATRMDREIAEIYGVKTSTIYSITFGISAALAAAAGSLLITYTPVTPNMGMSFTAKAFTVCVLGGLGNLRTIIPAGIILAFMEKVGGYYVGTSYTAAFGYGILLLVLVLSPSGLWGKKYY